MPVSRDASPTCDNLPRALFTHSEQLRIPINIIEPANTCRLFVANKQVLGYVICETTELHTEHVHIVARSRPKTLSQAEVASPAKTANESLRLHCLTSGRRSWRHSKKQAARLFSRAAHLFANVLFFCCFFFR
jgi:hypothetical protein